MRASLVIVLLSLSACTATRHAAPNPSAERFAGTWRGSLVRADEMWDVVLTLRADGALLRGVEQKVRGPRSVTWEIQGVAEANGLRLVETRVIAEERAGVLGNWCARSGLLLADQTGGRLAGSLVAASEACPASFLDLSRSPSAR